MNMISNNIDINKLTILLKKFNTKFRYRNGASKNISNYDIVRIVNVDILVINLHLNHIWL